MMSFSRCKKAYLNIAVMLFPFTGFTQSANSNNFQKMVDFLPPSPNAAAIIKHSDIGINKNTGSPSVNLPLLNLKGNKLSVGVSLTYASTGIKVDEIASRSGMGWVLNAGGVITRTVRGWPDETSYRLAPPFNTANYNCGTYSFLETIASAAKSGGADAEPDLFNYNMNGISGSFVFNASMNPVLIPAERYTIEKNFTSGASWNFKITTTDGIKYYFGGSGATEKTKRNNTCGKTYDEFISNAWYLTKIEHPNGESINFTYTTLTYSYETGVNETQHWAFHVIDTRDVPMNGVVSCPPGSTECNVPATTKCVNMVTTQGVLLSSIYNTSGSITISYTTRLDCSDRLIASISQTVGGQVYNTYNFSYNEQVANMNYANESALGHNFTPYLISLAEVSPDNVFTRTHKFIYINPANRPPRLSFSQDHWGYFNGKTNNTLIPKPKEFYLLQRFPSAIADREPDPHYAQMGLLSKIVYPTGGIDSLIYEGNDVLDDLQSYSTYHQYDCSATGTGYSTLHTQNTTFTIDKAQVVALEITSSTVNINQYDSLHQKGYVEVTGPNNSNILSEYFAASLTPYVRYLNPTWDLPAGTYTVTYGAKGSNQTLAVKLKYYPQTITASGKNKLTGGLRIKRVFTGNPGETPVLKRYYYANMDNLSVSSMLSVPRPVYNKDYEIAHQCQVSNNGNGQTAVGVNLYCHMTAMYSNSITNLFNYTSGLTSYGTVVESVGENFEGGATQTKFYANSDARPMVWWGNEILGGTLSNNSITLNGKPREETIYKKTVSGTLIPIKNTAFNYTIDSRAQTIIYGYTVNKKYEPAGWLPNIPCADNNVTIVNPIVDSYDANRYELDSYWAHLTSKTETNYDENGANPVTSITNFYYDDEQHLQPTRTEVTNSKNKLIKTSLTYPVNYTGTAVYDTMITKNIITPVIATTIKNENIDVTSEKINYTDAGNNNYVPGSIQKSNKGSAFETVGTFDLYDTKQNLLQYTDKSGMVTAIIWGYNRQYPVAQVTNSTYTNAVAQLTGGADAALQTMDGSALQTEINKIRMSLPDARVTTYTYKPMAGVTSITNPNNKTNTYIYDAFNRLLIVKDQDGNVVKKNDYVYTTPDANATLAIFFNAPLTKTYTCQTCAVGYTAASIQYAIPFGKYYSFISQQNADDQAAADNTGQEYTNRNAQCMSSVTCTGPQYRSVNCGCELGAKICENTISNGNGSHTVTYHYRWSDNYNGPSITETINCSGPDKKIVNCTCETGVKVCDNVVNNGGGSYTVTYHYHWSDNTNSQPITETFTCTGVDKKMINCTCETGVKDYISSELSTVTYQPGGCSIGQWYCTFRYKWSDGTLSTTIYSECSPVSCLPLSEE